MFIANHYLVISKYWETKYRLIIYRVIKLLLNITYPIYLVFNKKRYIDKKSEIIISMTSFPQRIQSVPYVVESLLRQTHPSQKIILWLATEQFQNIKLPRALLKLEKHGLEIRFCEDLRSHKKYYYAMKEYPDNIIVTVDDDMYYPENLLETLYSAYKTHSDCVIAMLTHRMKYSKDGILLGYEQWESAASNVLQPSFDLVPIGCEGVLYPPHILCYSVFDRAFFMKNCKNADDLWLKAMSLMNNKKVYPAIIKPFTFVNLMNTQTYSLNKSNNNENGNNVQLRNIIRKYPGLF